MRTKERWDEDWRFCEGDFDNDLPTYKHASYAQAKTERALKGPASKAFPDTDDYGLGKEIATRQWKQVTLPHDYTISQVPNEKYSGTRGYCAYTNAWYRKHFTLDPKDRDRRLTLFFEACSGISTIWLNGCLLKQNRCGYTSFEVDITDYVSWETENVLAVHIDARSQHEGWWYEGCGIYRSVWLVKAEKIAVDLWGIYVHPESPEEGNLTWNTPVEVTLRNDQDEDHLVTAQVTLLDPQGNAAGSASAQAVVPQRAKQDIHVEIPVENPALWDTESPNQYLAAVQIWDEGSCHCGSAVWNGKASDKVKQGAAPDNPDSIDAHLLCDELSVRYGYRTLRYDCREGLFLNGRHVIIKGVCCHQDYGLTGRAVPDRVARYRLKLLKEMGANGYRTSHYPHSETTMDALDEMGFLVMDETRWFESTEEGIRQLEMLVKRDRNRPGVIFWSIGNEEPIGKREEGARIARSLKAVVRRLDATRPVCAAICDDPLNAAATPCYDVIGINYNLAQYDAIHEKYPDYPIFASECCATGTTRGWYQGNDDKRGYINGYDFDHRKWRSREETWRFFLERPWVMGCYQWTGIEYRGETMWPRICSQSGALDLYLQRKDAFYQNQSCWLETPMVHLLPHWNWKGQESEPIRVSAYSNCQELELYLNGTSMGIKTLLPGAHAEWTVPYARGELKCIGRNGGQEVAVDVQKTTGRPAALKFRMDDAEAVRADGRDVAILTCYVVDSEGNPVPDASPVVEFSTNGPGIVEATGSDVSDHVPPDAQTRRMRAGLISVLVRAGQNPGTLRVYARSEGLDTAVTEITLGNC